MTADLELVLDAGADLGEAPSWDARSDRLLWVDITAGIVHRFDPRSGRDETFEVGQPVGAAVPTIDGGWALAVSDGFATLDPATGVIERIADVETEIPETMMNDGKCDPAGRLWAGTKDVEGRRPIGSLYRLDEDHTLARVVTGVTVSNGLGWSPDQATMYFIDSPTHTIEAFDFDAASSDVWNRRRLVEFPETWGLPDGMTVDEEGSLWVAFWSGSAVRRIAPDGRVTAVVEFPVSQVTSCAFGSADLSDLYVTSAKSDLSPAQLAEQPQAGGLFRLRPGVRSLPQRPFIG